MTLRLVYNPADTPVAIDSDGRSLGGREWGTVESTDAVGGTALKTEALLEVDEMDGEDLHPSYVVARNAHRALVTRTEQARKLDKTKLAELVPDVESNRKTELVREVAAADVAIPRSGRSRATKES